MAIIDVKMAKKEDEQPHSFKIQKSKRQFQRKELVTSNRHVKTLLQSTHGKK
jgi:hypothetical protein